MAECLGDELINASKGAQTSEALKKKDEIERTAKSSR